MPRETDQSPPSISILRIGAVCKRTGIPKSSVYAAMEVDDPELRFPAPVKLGPRRVGWIEGEVESWLSTQIAKRGRPAPTRPRVRRLTGGGR
jgi:prophage regulatory protein